MSQRSRILPSEITPEAVYRGRREFLAGIAGAGILAAAPATLAQQVMSVTLVEQLRYQRNASYSTSEKANSFAEVTGYNNFYEFGTGKEDPAENAERLRTRPWSVVIDGECEKPGRLALEDLLKPHPLEERIYRLRCVEAWSMVIPWIGFPLAGLVQRFQPTSRAKFVEFTTLHDPKQMPGQRYDVLDWPYVEGLRMDEAMHPLQQCCRGDHFAEQAFHRRRVSMVCGHLAPGIATRTNSPRTGAPWNVNFSRRSDMPLPAFIQRRRFSAAR